MHVFVLSELKYYYYYYYYHIKLMNGMEGLLNTGPGSQVEVNMQSSQFVSHFIMC